MGILRTVPEAYLGSRPESLFGMVENQTIPLADLLAEVESRCRLLDTLLQPEICMGPFESELLLQRNRGGKAIERWLGSRLVKRVEAARPALGERERGIGIRSALRRRHSGSEPAVGPTLEALPEDESSPEYRAGISDLFGASVRLVARKAGHRTVPVEGRLRAAYPEVDDVVLAFPPEVMGLFDPRRFLLPDIQVAGPELDRHFPAADWTAVLGGNGIRDLVPQVAEPRVVIPVRDATPILVLVRICVIFEGRPYTVALSADGIERKRLSVFQADSVLLAEVLPGGRGELLLSLRATALDGGPMPVDAFRVSYAGAFAV